MEVKNIYCIGAGYVGGSTITVTAQKCLDINIAVVAISNHQKSRILTNIIKTLYNTVSRKKVTMLGWAFKKDTNSARESTTIHITDELLEEEASISVYDPKVKEERIFTDLDDLISRSLDQNRELLTETGFK